MLKRIFKDPIIYVLLAVNIALAFAFFKHIISAETILFTYYFQSLTLGISYFIQILTIKNYSVSDLKFNGQQVEKNSKTKGCLGGFFVFHYGFFHLGYIVFLLISFDFNVNKDYLLYAVLAFGVGELAAVVRRHIQFENEIQNIGSMMFTPYLRIIPMHIFIIAGGFFGYKNPTIFAVFIILKILSDVLMHIIVNKTYLDKTIKQQPIDIQL